MDENDGVCTCQRHHTLAQRLLPTQYKVTDESPLARQAGLVRDSIVDCGVIYTIAKNRVERKIGAFSPQAMAEVEVCLKTSLALP